MSCSGHASVRPHQWFCSGSLMMNLFIVNCYRTNNFINAEIVKHSKSLQASFSQQETLKQEIFQLMSTDDLSDVFYSTAAAQDTFHAFIQCWKVTWYIYSDTTVNDVLEVLELHFLLLHIFPPPVSSYPQTKWGNTKSPIWNKQTNKNICILAWVYFWR